MQEYISLFKRHVQNLKKLGSSLEWRGLCPYHACRGKKKSKFYINETTGQFKCHRCGEKGNAITFARDFGEDETPYFDSATQSPKPILDLARIESFHQYLLDHPEHWRAPWKKEVLEKLQVGWDPKRQSLTFPIFDTEGAIVALYRHKQMFEGNGRMRLYPEHLISTYDRSYLVICEGLVDVVSLFSIRIQVVSSTAGASGVPEDLSALHKFEKFYLCLDNDIYGEAGVEEWLNRLIQESP